MNQKTDSPRMEVSVTPKLVIDEVSTGPAATVRSHDASTGGDGIRVPERSSAGAVEVSMHTTVDKAGEASTKSAPPESVPPPSSNAASPADSPAPTAEVTEHQTTRELAAQSLAAPPPPPQSQTPPPPIAANVAHCDVNVATESTLVQPTATALAALNAATPNITFHVSTTGPISIAHGGEWPTSQPPLGWTAPDRRTILINPDHPASGIDTALADVIVHEMGHVLISTEHVADGTILDPQIDGRITIGQADHDHLKQLTCTQLGL